jgi:phospholipase C
MRIVGAAVAAVLALPIFTAEAASGLNRISHIIVLYLENRSFDNLLIPGSQRARNSWPSDSAARPGGRAPSGSARYQGSI